MNTGGVHGRIRLERLIANVLRPLGPSIAIGAPREWLPPEGALARPRRRQNE